MSSPIKQFGKMPAMPGQATIEVIPEFIYDTIVVKAGTALTGLSQLFTNSAKTEFLRNATFPFTAGRVKRFDAMKIVTNVRFADPDTQKLWEETCSISVKIEDKDYFNIPMALYNNMTRVLGGVVGTENDGTTTTNISSNVVLPGANGMAVLPAPIRIPELARIEIALRNFINAATDSSKGVAKSVLLPHMPEIANDADGSLYQYVRIIFASQGTREIR